MQHHPAVLKYAYQFNKTTGIPVEDLIQEAELIMHQALIYEGPGKYDPRKSSKNTYITMCVYTGMCNVAKRHKEKTPDQPTCEIDEAISDGLPSQEDVLYMKELIASLPADAKSIADMVTQDPFIRGLSPTNAKRYIRQKMMHFGAERIEEAFAAITQMLTLA